MRAVVGFVGLHVLFIGLGLALLRAMRLTPDRLSARGLLWVLGPAMLVGMCAAVPVQIVLLVLGVPLTPVVTVLACSVVGLTAMTASRRMGAAPQPIESGGGGQSSKRWIHRGAGLVAAVYFALGVWALVRLRTVLDDARIWSLKGLTLTYYHHLEPEIFQNQGQAGAHPVYPLFQPALEALLFQSMGSAQLRLFHAELWLVFATAVWTAVYLIARRSRAGVLGSLWLLGLALLAVTPAVVINVSMGYADVTGSILLGVGGLAVALWLDDGQMGFIGLAAILLAGAASTKDEDLLGVLLVMVAAAVLLSAELRARPWAGWLRDRAGPFVGAASVIAILVLPWRLWTRAHHLTDGVEPSVPHALDPSYILGRGHELHQAATAMLTQTLDEFGWLLAIFLVACIVCFITGQARRIASFYLIAFALIIVALLWLYTTTAEPLSFLIPTSMNRTVDVFMILAAIGTSHLIATLVGHTSVATSSPT